MTGDMQMIDEYTVLWMKRLIMIPIIMNNMDWRRRDVDNDDHNNIDNYDKGSTAYMINRDDSNIEVMKKIDRDERGLCRSLHLQTYLKHCSFMSYLHPLYIKGLITGKYNHMSML